jgi:hypothetical protein
MATVSGAAPRYNDEFSRLKELALFVCAKRAAQSGMTETRRTAAVTQNVTSFASKGGLASLAAYVYLNMTYFEAGLMQGTKDLKLLQCNITMPRSNKENWSGLEARRQQSAVDQRQRVGGCIWDRCYARVGRADVGRQHTAAGLFQ